MPRSKVPGHGKHSGRRKSSRSRDLLEVVRFLGVSLSGGKNDKTFVSVLEYYPQHKKLFLSHIYDKIKTEGEVSGDALLFQILQHGHQNVQSIAIDAPLSLPQCMTCKLKCPGFENCNEKHIKWFWDHYRDMKQKKKTHRLFTPYTQRCVETYINEELPEKMGLNHALGANLAPLTARALFLQKRLKGIEMFEVYTPLSMLRIGKGINASDKDIKYYRHSMDGFECRARLIKRIIEKDLAFIYQQDIQRMLEAPNAFDSFIAALTGFLKHQNHCEERPASFPKKEGWIEFPVAQFQWKL